VTNLFSEFLTRDELAKALDRDPRTIDRLEKQPNGLPFIKMGARKLYNIESVRKWLASLERKPNPRRDTSRMEVA
jgi:hypothetical protein